MIQPCSAPRAVTGLMIIATAAVSFVARQTAVRCAIARAWDNGFIEGARQMARVRESI